MHARACVGVHIGAATAPPTRIYHNEPIRFIHILRSKYVKLVNYSATINFALKFYELVAKVYAYRELLIRSYLNCHHKQCQIFWRATTVANA